jgi:hypothetical protein
MPTFISDDPVQLYQVEEFSVAAEDGNIILEIKPRAGQGMTFVLQPLHAKALGLFLDLEARCQLGT